jgi:uncharacterized protein (TIGR03435 family)
MRRLLVSGLLIVGSIGVFAQTNAPAVALEAASIKPAPPGSRGVVPGNWAPPTSSSAHLRPQTLRTLVMYTFDTQRHDPQPVGGPPWIDQNLYELTLKFTGLPTLPQARTLIRGLLEDRFKLRWHTEKRESAVYVLTPARSDRRLGDGLRPSAIDCRAYSETLTRTGRGAVAKELNADCGLLNSGREIRGTATVTELVKALQRHPEADRPILDRSGLTGTFDINLTLGLESVFTALPDQLGLKLEASREPRDIVIIDSAELPEPD